MSLSPREQKMIGFGSFLRDKIYLIILAAIFLIILLLFFSALRLSSQVLILLGVFWVGFIITILIVEYLRRRNFYRSIISNIHNLDQSYLVLETIESPQFYDGQIFYNILYDINKSMAENVQKYSTLSREFQEYVEMWIHEVKTPLATLSLLSRDPRVNEQIKRLNDYVEQILYFARAENAERDYLIGEVDLAKIIGEVASRNREILLANRINFEVGRVNYQVYTDAKWLEFILNQIITNSIKYQSSLIRISAQPTEHEIILSIFDNGIGIDVKDLPRVFDKSFTGKNGRTGQQSTGMGLYIAKTLCDKLGHQITIDSVTGEYTEVKITIAKNDYYKVIYKNK